MAVDVRFRVGSLIADMESYQWDYSTEKEYLERNFGESGYGRLHRVKLDSYRNILTVTFIKSNLVMATLREISTAVARRFQAVRFYPDKITGVYMLLDWPQNVAFEHVIDNRKAITLEIRERL